VLRFGRSRKTGGGNLPVDTARVPPERKSLPFQSKLRAAMAACRPGQSATPAALPATASPPRIRVLLFMLLLKLVVAGLI
jgi:hypothetical protein